MSRHNYLIQEMNANKATKVEALEDFWESIHSSGLPYKVLTFPANDTVTVHISGPTQTLEFQVWHLM